MKKSERNELKKWMVEYHLPKAVNDLPVLECGCCGETLQIGDSMQYTSNYDVYCQNWDCVDGISTSSTCFEDCWFGGKEDFWDIWDEVIAESKEDKSFEIDLSISWCFVAKSIMAVVESHAKKSFTKGEARDEVKKQLFHMSQVADEYVEERKALPEVLTEYKALVGRVRKMATAMRRHELGDWVNDWLNDGILDGKAIVKAEGGAE